ncbi:MAG: preprotein translocase subunit YajC [Oscillospiraceae bacterium]
MEFALFSAASQAATQDTTGGLMGNISLFVIMGVMIVGMYFLMWRPNKKKEKQAAEMRNNLEVGDEVVTIGGVVGRVVSIKDDTFVLETAGERSRIRFLRGAVDKVNKLTLDGSDSSKDKADKGKSDK